MITTECRNTLINDLQCKLATHSSKVSKALSFRKKNLPCLEEYLFIAFNMINAMKRYTTFTDDLVAVWSVSFDNPDEVTTDVTLTVDGTAYVYSGSGDGTDIAQYFGTYFDELTIGAATWYTETDAGTLYLYSYDTAVDTVTCTAVDTALDITVTDLDTDGTAILDIWNCLTYEEICSMYEFTNKLINDSTCNC